MGASFHFLPFRFRPLGGKVLLVSEVGEYLALTRGEWQRIAKQRIFPGEELFYNLEAKDFVCREYTPARIDRIAAKYRTKKKFLFESTALHMFVVTHRCNQSCSYCHASSIETALRSASEDMSPDVARHCVARAFESSSPYLKFEFQGGEPTLNFETIEAVVHHARHLNENADKRVEFVICTNLYDVKEAHLLFLRKYGIQVSTSFDGPAMLHNSCRKTFRGKGTYSSVMRNITRVRDTLGSGNLSALLTVTRYNVEELRQVIDEYVSNNFESIFIRRLNMFGNAETRKAELDYSQETFLAAYLDALQYLIELNKRGVLIIEEFAAILLTKILTPFGAGFVDMQSPAGAGLSAVIYNVDGKVFVSDEARMLYRSTGENTFCLGNACTANRRELFTAPIIEELMSASTLECLPGCGWCAYLPYCGSDPVRNFSLHGKLVSFKPHDPWCEFYKKVFDYLFGLLLSEDEELIDILWSWATRCGAGRNKRRNETTAGNS